MACCKDKQFWPSFRLNNDISMPAIGFGTYRIRKETNIMRAVDEALAAGYRLFDTAAVYDNEKHLKKAFETLLPKYDLEREDLFITSKLSPYEMHTKKVIKDAYEHSVQRLGIDYLDLFLIHFPGIPNEDPAHTKHKTLRNIAWSMLTELYDSGLVNAIGVSNFTIRHLQLLNDNHSVIPTVNQVEWHPFFHDEKLFEFCRQNDIVIQGYSPFGGAKSKGCLLANKEVNDIAKALSVTPAQVLLSWSLQRDVAVIPKSINPEHIRSNFQIDFKLSREEMKILNHLHTGSKFAWDPYPFI